MAGKRKQGDEGSSAATAAGVDASVGDSQNPPPLADQNVASAAANAQDSSPADAGDQVDVSQEADVQDSAPAASTSEQRLSTTPTRSPAARGTGQLSLSVGPRVTRSATSSSPQLSLSVTPRVTRSATSSSSQRSLSVTPRVTRNAAAATKRQTRSGGSAPVAKVAEPRRGSKRKGSAPAGSSSFTKEAVAERKSGKKKSKSKVEGSGYVLEEAVAEPENDTKGKGKVKVEGSSSAPEVAVAEPKRGAKDKGKAKVEESGREAATVDAGSDQAGKTLVIEHFVKRPSTAFTPEADDFKRQLEIAIPGVNVLINPDLRETGFFTIRQQGDNGDTFLDLSDMNPPFEELKVVNKSAKVKEIADRLNNEE